MPQNVAQQHVVFRLSAAGMLGQLFEKMGKTERILALPDDLSFGPINPVSFELRQTWNQHELGYEISDADYGLPDDILWTHAISSAFKPVAWVHRRCSKEYCTFLEFIWRLNGASCDAIYVDTLNINIADGQKLRAPRSFSEISVDNLLKASSDIHQSEYHWRTINLTPQRG